MKKALLFILLIILCTGLVIGGLFWANKAKNTIYIYDPGEYFITNVNSGNKILKTDIIIEFKNNSKKKFLNDNQYKIRDAIIFVLRSKSENDLTSDNIKQTLSNEIIDKLNNEFGLNAVNLYFNEFIME